MYELRVKNIIIISSELHSLWKLKQEEVHIDISKYIMLINNSSQQVIMQKYYSQKIYFAVLFVPFLYLQSKVFWSLKSLKPNRLMLQIPKYFIVWQLWRKKSKIFQSCIFHGNIYDIKESSNRRTLNSNSIWNI